MKLNFFSTPHNKNKPTNLRNEPFQVDLPPNNTNIYKLYTVHCADSSSNMVISLPLYILYASQVYVVLFRKYIF